MYRTTDLNARRSDAANGGTAQDALWNGQPPSALSGGQTVPVPLVPARDHDKRSAMRIISVGTLKRFLARDPNYADARDPMMAWDRQVARADWSTPADVKAPDQDGKHPSLVTLVEAWEAKHYPLDLPDPIEAIKYHMESQGLTPRDLQSLHRQPQSRLRGAGRETVPDADNDPPPARRPGNSGRIAHQSGTRCCLVSQSFGISSMLSLT